MTTANLGAHEVMEIHEVLNDTINGINQFQLYRPHVQDSQLRSILDHQIEFMTQEYNTLVNAVSQKGLAQAVPYRTPVRKTSPVYGLNNPQPFSPHTSINQLNDRDIASGMLSFHKSAAVMQMIASLECADPSLRNIVRQGAINCSEKAYEVWSFMNQKGYYQVPTLKDNTTQTWLHQYAPVNGVSALGQHQFGTQGNQHVTHFNQHTNQNQFGNFQ